MPNPVCFIDSTYYNRTQYSEIASALIDYPDICLVNDRTLQFKVTGILFAAGKPIVIFPKNYDSREIEANAINEAKTLIRVLIRYKNEPYHEKSEIPMLFGNAEMNSSRITAAMLILDDYCQNGIIRRQNEESALHKSGRIDWAATINKTAPVFSDSHPVYVSPIVRRHISDENNIICVIHRYVVDECFHEWGWCFGYDDYNAPQRPLPFTTSEAILALKNELRNAYVEREIHVIKAMIVYLQENCGTENNKQIDVLATPYFSFVWEAVCGYILVNQYPRLKSLLPQPEWESDLVSGNISQRPDIFYVQGDALYILDAKYYNYFSNIPGWHDAVKQFFYRHTLMGVMHGRPFIKLLPNTQTIFNAFIFPGNDEAFTYVGRIHVPRAENLGEIRAFALNQKRALSSYAFHDDSHFNENVRRIICESFM